MGRLKSSKVKRSALGRVKVQKRWLGSATNVENDSRPMVSGDEDSRPRPKPIVHEDVRPGSSKEYDRCPSPFVEETLECNTETPPKKSRPTGFELVASYNTPVTTNAEGPTYCLMDVVCLTNFLQSVPCKYCYDINSEIKVSKVFGFAQKISVHCNSCNESYSFYSSQRINQDPIEGTSKRKNPFDVD